MNELEKTVQKNMVREIARWKKEAARHRLFGEEMIKVWVDGSSRASLKKLAEIQDKAEHEANLLYP